MKKRCLKSFYFVALLLCTSAASATPIWQNGDLTTYGQVDWSADPGGLLTTNYDSNYAPSGVVEIGIHGTAGFSVWFSDAGYVLSYLPATGPNAALDVDLLDPSTTPSGAFGGTVLAMRLNIDFSDTGALPRNSSVAFGDLMLMNYSALPSLNGLTVRDISGLANTLLGGGSNGYSIDDIATVAAQLNIAFANGTPDTFAQDYLRAPNGSQTPVPEPPTLVLLVIGLLGLIGTGATYRRA